jgi:hypothetical protein
MTEALLVTAGGGLSQGDLVIAPVARVTTSSLVTPDRWDRLDEHEVRVRRGAQEDDDIHLATGRALLMVTSHDCHHDKEWNETVRKHMKAGVAQEAAEQLAEEDETLDRTFQASPLVPLDDFPPNKRSDLRAGRVVGFFPVPQNQDVGVPEAVVDLTYRITVDRFSVEERLFGLDQQGRAQLRLCLARFDALRSVNFGAELEAVVGSRIIDVAVQRDSPIEIELTLESGTVIRLLQQPGEPGGGGRRGL